MFKSSLFPTQKIGQASAVWASTDTAEAPNLLFLHGLFGGTGNFDRLAAHLGEGWDILTPELPLYQKKPSVSHLRDLTDWLVENFNAQLERGIHVVGNSLGGHLAVDLAARYPEFVNSLCLTGSSGLIERAYGGTRPRRYDRKYIRDIASRTFYGREIEESVVDDLIEVVSNYSKMSRLISIARASHRYNMQRLLAGIKVPVLLVWGENDEITPPEVALEFEQHLPNASLVWVSDCGHAPMMEHPKFFADCLSNFLNEIIPSPQEPVSVFGEP